MVGRLLFIQIRVLFVSKKSGSMLVSTNTFPQDRDCPFLAIVGWPNVLRTACGHVLIPKCRIFVPAALGARMLPPFETRCGERPMTFAAWLYFLYRGAPGVALQLAGTFLLLS